ncbi:LysR family transcriptional regulator [Massilia sp. NR 4-1]|uniref:LysR substrate-binding domain-containing protein n=1 Tax=Massilia sp. NR 4-1 TaxID=1678028 RepID=UPI00067AF14E|nr:LysR family transcriptional regulator [Massilia sp. NR 4-1]AKU24376.1 LysR family transcriptional regulator [Massilia sp. NR 4-1]
MRKLDTRSLQIFSAVATCLSFRQAADQLHMTQPPLNRAVRELEQRLGARLFERDTQGVALTPAGAALLPLAQHILGLLDAAEDAVRAAASGNAQRHPAQAAAAGRAGQAGRPVALPRLRLGLTTSVESGLFRPFTDALAASATLDLHFDSSPRLVAALRNGRLDAAVIALPTRSHELDVLPLGPQPMLAALPSAHPLARRRRLALRDLQDTPLFWFERARQPAFFDHCHKVFRHHRFAPVFLREPHDHHVLLGDVAAGRGVALLPASFAALRRKGVAYRALDEGAELAVGLGLASAGTHPALAALRAQARRMLGGEPAA